ncbi:MAG: signal recognition particle-docking protein FtsY [Planctomycetota bacterium]|nr:MAG: signal recognition particle-docking protein FtsY [Planctomycetota bacterium]
MGLFSKKKENPTQNSNKKEKPGLFAKLRAGLQKTRKKITSQLKNLFSIRRRVDEELCEEIFEVLVSTDMGVEIAQTLVDELQQAYKDKEIHTQNAEEIYQYLKNKLKSHLKKHNYQIQLAPTPPTVLLIAGVNGSGKTTSIAKLANLFRQQGKKVMLAAGDTFRAAAVEQLDIWAKRLDVDIVKRETGADPASVAYDALDSALAKGHDIVIVDTAGRLHTQTHLMKELEKIHRVISKKIPNAPHEILLVLDATTGQNALQQAKAFKEAIQITGLFLAKLDGTAKGGIAVAIHQKMDVPVKFVGLGETPNDIEPFNVDKFVEALFE